MSNVCLRNVGGGFAVVLHIILNESWAFSSFCLAKGEFKDGTWFIDKNFNEVIIICILIDNENKCYWKEFACVINQVLIGSLIWAETGARGKVKELPTWIQFILCGAGVWGKLHGTSLCTGCQPSDERIKSVDHHSYSDMWLSMFYVSFI